MVLSDVFARFVQDSPACVMYRAVMEKVFAPAELDALFRRWAVMQYERELLFSTVVDVMGLVVCRISPSVHAAYVRKRDQISVSVRALYDKLSHVEIGISQALVQHSASQVRELIDLCRGVRRPLLKGYTVRILDGNHLSGTDHRLKVLRDTAAGALPGQSLVLLDPQRLVIDNVIPCEDGHTQERALLDQVLPTIQKRDLLIDDRNFCTLGYPKAALFAFCVAVCAYNLLAAVKGAMRGVHGEETMETKVSDFFLTEEISGTYRGMMIALPPKEWQMFQTMRPARLVTHLRRWARLADLGNYPKHPRGPKKPQPPRPNAQFRHVATARLLEEARELRRKKRKPKSASP